MDTKKIKAVELILDWNLWPRSESNDLDTTNISRMKLAMQANIKLPAIIVNKKDNRVVDGFHRVTAALSFYGDGAEIEAEFRDYKDDAEMFLDSAQLNSKHGLPLSPRDRVHVILKAHKYKIPIPIIADAIGMDGESAKKFLEKRTATTKSGERVPLPGGMMRGFSGKVLTEQQENFAKTYGQAMPMNFYTRMLLDSLKSHSFIIDEKTIDLLKKLEKEIAKVLLEVAS